MTPYTVCTIFSSARARVTQIYFDETPYDETEHIHSKCKLSLLWWVLQNATACGDPLILEKDEFTYGSDPNVHTNADTLPNEWMILYSTFCISVWEWELFGGRQ